MKDTTKVSAVNATRPEFQGMSALEHRQTLGMQVNVANNPDATQSLLEWAKSDQSRYIDAANTPTVIQACDQGEFDYTLI